MIDPRIERWEGYKLYHVSMMKAGDCDPQYPALRYIADRQELNPEQRFWLAFLFSLSYCAPTAFYMLSEFPDYENVDERRMERWWAENKHRTLFQTDRTKVKNFDKVVPCFVSYRELVGDSQVKAWEKLLVPGDERATYRAAFRAMGKLFYFGRFSLFLLLEAVHHLTGFPMRPDELDLREAESCRNGVCYALGKDEWVRQPVPKGRWLVLQAAVRRLEAELTAEHPELPVDLWNIETSLCAWKKLFWRTRYFGYYIDRQQEEITTMEKLVPHGVYWRLLWEFRREYFRPGVLGEVSGWKGIRKDQMGVFMATGKLGNGVEHRGVYRHAVSVPCDPETYKGEG